MKATGIIRRTDDLGRIVIPKELRRSMHIETGAPLEIYVSKDGQMICFKKYNPIEENEWEKITRVVNAILPCDFILYNTCDEKPDELKNDRTLDTKRVIERGECECELWFPEAYAKNPLIDTAVEVIETLLELCEE